MRQVKIFEGPEASDIETDINKWLKNNLDIEIHHMLQSESAVSDDDGDLCGNTTITLLYSRHE